MTVRNNEHDPGGNSGFGAVTRRAHGQGNRSAAGLIRLFCSCRRIDMLPACGGKHHDHQSR